MNVPFTFCNKQPKHRGGGGEAALLGPCAFLDDRGVGAKVSKETY